MGLLATESVPSLPEPAPDDCGRNTRMRPPPRAARILQTPGRDDGPDPPPRSGAAIISAANQSLRPTMGGNAPHSHSLASLRDDDRLDGRGESLDVVAVAIDTVVNPLRRRLAMSVSSSSVGQEVSQAHRPYRLCSGRPDNHRTAPILITRRADQKCRHGNRYPHHRPRAPASG